MNMISNKESITEAILKVSRKLAAIIAVIAVIGFSFTTCKGDDDEADDPINLPSAGDGSIDFTTAKKYPVKGAGSETIEFTHCYGGGDDYDVLSDLFEDDYEVKITDGELSLKLGTLKDELLEEAWGDSITSGFKIFGIRHFVIDFNDELSWGWSNKTKTGHENEVVIFVYANMPGKMTDYYTFMKDGWTYYSKIDMDLKQGWNTVIEYGMGDDDKKISASARVTGKPQDKHKWRLW